ncbi:MAG: methyltransferase [Alphaproteobacteria bacterium]|nr:methyltransferase [Alphaproteobacteria bacterium]
MDTTPGPDESLDRLVGDWHILQLKRGHRFSTDDLLVAWTAGQAAPRARRLLDIGAGIGSVGLMTLWQMPADAHLTMVEVQPVSHRLARRTVALNGLSERVTLKSGDLRDPEMVPETRDFEVVTGSPPYIPLGHGVVSPHPQRAGARMELKGDVFDYCRAAARALAPDGRFCFCHAGADPRPEQAVEAAGLTLLHRQDVLFRVGQPPTIALFCCAWAGERRDLPPLVVRGDDGRWTPTYQQVRAAVGAIPDPFRG